ncbi:hypothetical protein BSL82_04440 [Tardibacter chloracetimidivorans]|uniref:Uncharacterized protein n=1 Tax=Tardibacter chloracetimidivorans TaxID=1921510 RepID=A0A1L3ZSP2_9SPHN|nr:hypothetical protein [Tardibacter chloracetimidivorans]API58651.1 hypothetical protein BSL82_04440 [Tardibacter chloracetimidivorans]
MHPELEASPEESVDLTRKRPRVSASMWQPWYAKLWWGASASYWTGKLISFCNPSLDELYTSAVAGYLNLVFYPVTAFMVLGVGFLRAWMDFNGWEWGPPTGDQLFPKRSVGGFRDPMADPLDPRSPSHWRYLDDIK